MSDINVSMTAVHIIAGATRNFAAYAKVARQYGGENGLNRELVSYAPRVERVYQALSAKYDFGNWPIDVVENFGESCLDRAWLGDLTEAYFQQFMLYASAATQGGIEAADMDMCRKAWHGPSSPFLETYSSAWVSMAHVSPRTLDGLNALRDSDALPFWISSTLYGYIVRFDALATYDVAEDEASTIVKRLAVCSDLGAIAALLAANGLDAAHLDADGPIIEGLREYEH